jgi:hypothetical protein
MAPKRSTAAFGCRRGVLWVGDVQLDGQQTVGVPERLRDGVGVAAGRDDIVAGGQRRLGDVDTQAASSAGDQPSLFVRHLCNLAL